MKTVKRIALRRMTCLAAAALLTACGGGGSSSMSMSSTTPVMVTSAPATPTASAYSMSKLVSDGSVAAVTTDKNLVNPWGIVFGAGAPVWIANNGTQTSTLYQGTGTTIPLVVNVPAGSNGAADPTGIIANGTLDFVVSENTKSAPAAFIFAGESGTISGWASSVDLTNAVTEYDDGAGGAVYKGLAIANNGTANLLYAADFHNNKIDVFDASFAKVTTAGKFVDSTLPTGYAPFGIQALDVGGATSIYVAYAQQDSAARNNVTGAGLGLVDVYDAGGTLKMHLIPAGGKLNSPWGMTLAPANFGTLSNQLLVGNFGDGSINAFDPSTGSFVGSVSDSSGQPIANPGLWGIAFGNNASNQPATTLFFAAGIANQAAGLYGRIDLGATPPDIVAPTVSLTAPANGATVSGSVTLTASAADNVGVKSVQFLAGATSIATVTTSPYTASWNATAVSNGAVSLTAVATDAAGNSTTSAAVTVAVDNTAPAPMPTPTPPPMPGY